LRRASAAGSAENHQHPNHHRQPIFKKPYRHDRLDKRHRRAIAMQNWRHTNQLTQPHNELKVSSSDTSLP
jgi:hypothetical protein